MIAHIFKGMGRQVGLTSTDGIVIDERLVVAGRRLGAALGPDGAAEPAGRLRRVRGGPRRDPARGPRLRAQRRRGGPQRHRRPPGPAAGSTPSSSWPRSSRWWSRPCPATATAVLNADDPLVRRDAPALLGRGGLVLHGGRTTSWSTPTARRGGRAVVLEDGPPGRHDRDPPRAGDRCRWPAPTCCPATFGGRARMNVQNALAAAAAAAYAAGAHLHDIRQGLRTFTTSLLPGARAAQPVRARRRAGHRRLLPQRGRHAHAGRLRRPPGRPRPRAATSSPGGASG